MILQPKVRKSERDSEKHPGNEIIRFRVRERDKQTSVLQTELSNWQRERETKRSVLKK